MSMNVRGFVLPDIPADLLASYPYAVIAKLTTPQGSAFTMAAWKETPVYVDSSLTAMGFAFITANSKSDSAYTFTEDGATSWGGSYRKHHYISSRRW